MTTILKSLAVSALLMATTVSYSQEKVESPRDSVSGKIGDASITVSYGSPSVKQRKIWGALVPYNTVWRAGANEATVFTTDKAIKVEGKDLPAGQYSFFAIPGEKEWTIIFNKTAKQWGAYKYAESNDALRVVVKSKKSSSLNERLVYKINKKSLSLLWENLEVPVSIQ